VEPVFGAKKIALDASKARRASRKPGGRHKGNQAAKSLWHGAADLRPLARTKRRKQKSGAMAPTP
jgi:hypothetical protein